MRSNTNGRAELPTLNFSLRGTNNFTKFIDCAVCSSDINILNPNNNLAESFCGHYFHADCFEERLKTYRKCPIDDTALTRINKTDDKRNVAPEEKIHKGLTVGPLEVRISRMHLSERSKNDDENVSNNCYVRACRKFTHVKSCCGRNESRPKTAMRNCASKKPTLGSQINPLMTILMSPHLRQFIDQEKQEYENEDESNNSKPRLIRHMKIKSLEFPDQYVTNGTRNRARTTKFFKRSKSLVDRGCGNDKYCERSTYYVGHSGEHRTVTIGSISTEKGS